MWKFMFVLMALAFCICAADPIPKVDSNEDSQNDSVADKVKPDKLPKDDKSVFPLLSSLFNAIKPIPLLTKQAIINLHPKDDNEKVQGESVSYSSHTETKNGVTTVDKQKGDIVENKNGKVTETKFENKPDSN